MSLIQSRKLSGKHNSKLDYYQQKHSQDFKKYYVEQTVDILQYTASISH